ncbi:hypothetical protein JCM19233_1957 [Vibrio astriarenae]|nr:hypothetical protein JCM19233_1957 [Vibrio sp. C7]
MTEQNVAPDVAAPESGNNKQIRRTKRAAKPNTETLLKLLKSKRSLVGTLRSLPKESRDSILLNLKNICEEIDLEEEVKREEEAKQKALVETMTAQLESQGLSRNAIVSILTNK